MLFSVPLQRAYWLYPLVLLLTVLFSNLVPAGNIALARTMVSAIALSCCAHLTPLRRLLPQGRPCAAGSEAAAAEVAQGLLAAGAAQSSAGAHAAAATAPARLYYLDNLKSCLTLLVVVHHTLGAFGGIGSLGLSVGNFRNGFQVFSGTLQILNQAYFMSLFFFISAYLTPASLDKKGPAAFLADRLRRLGLPFLAFFLIVGPLQTLYVDYFVRQVPLSYNPNAGQCWFVGWLLVFNAALLATSGPAVAWALPSLPLLCALGAGLGALQGLQILLLPAYFFMPITFGSLPFDAAFFAAGIAAARGGWLQPQPAAATAWGAALGALLLGLGFAGGMAALYAQGGGLGLLNKNPCGAPPDRGEASTPLALLLGALLALATLAGVYAMCVSVAALHLFRRHCNFTTPLWRWLSSASYAVYLLHSLVVLPLTHLFFVAVRRVRGEGLLRAWGAPGGGLLVDNAGCLASNPPAEAETAATLAIGFVLVTSASLLITYPLAAAIKRIPCLSHIL
jgi:glucan biosynthesis protein C